MSGETPTVHFELIAWATVFVGGDGSERKEFEEPLLPGDTVLKALKRLSARFSELDGALWHGGTDKLGEHIEIAVNDAVLGIRHNLDSEIKDGDTIILMGQYMGG